MVIRYLRKKTIVRFNYKIFFCLKIRILSIIVAAETHFFSPLLVPQGGTHPAANKGGQDPGGVSVLRQHQVRHLRDRGVPAVGPGLRLGAVVSLPQPTKVLVGTTQPHSSNKVVQLRGLVNKFQLKSKIKLK